MQWKPPLSRSTLLFRRPRQQRGMRKLSNEEIEEIRNSDELHDVLAERYGCSPWTIKAKRRGFAKLGRPLKPRPLCLCGCGELVRSPQSRYVQGHHQRSLQANWRSNPLFLGAREPQTDSQFLRSTFDQCEEVDRGHTSPCWLWTGRVMATGYSLSSRHVDGVPRITTRHREIFGILNPDVDLTGCHVDHLCGSGAADLSDPDRDARRCMNPQHLMARPIVDHLRRHHSRLTRGQVDDIRRRHAAGERATELAKEFDYHRDAMSQVINGKRWADA
jgi:hypothetical protein